MPTDNLKQLEDWAGALLAKLAPAERRRLSRTIAQDLRRSQRARIAAQRNPDGSAYAPRKHSKHLRGKTGRIKRQAGMFLKLRNARFLKARGTADAALVEFTGRTGRIARVHQYGLRDNAGPHGPQVHYAERQLLGFTDADRELVRDKLINHLAGT